MMDMFSHHPSSPPSTKALGLLRSSLANAYPKGSDKGPLEFQLDVVEAPPNADQLTTILSYMPSQATNPSMVFLSVHPSAPSGTDAPSTTKAIAELAAKNPNALKWPIVVDWLDGKAAVGDVKGVENMLEHLRKRRDGEVENEKVDQPKGWFQ